MKNLPPYYIVEVQHLYCFRISRFEPDEENRRYRTFNAAMHRAKEILADNINGVNVRVVKVAREVVAFRRGKI